MDHSDAFDYWGKGTQVTVEGKDMPLTIYPVVECSSASQLKIGCISTGLKRDSSFEWMDSTKKALTDFVQFPALPRDEAYAKMSFITVKKEDFDNGKHFECKVGNGKATIPDAKTPTVNLAFDGKSIMCMAEDFFPKDVSIKLKKDGHVVSGQNWPATRNSPALHYTAGRVLKVNKTSWDKNTEYTCEVTHESKTSSESRYFAAKFSLKINPPSVKDLFDRNKAVITCVVTGDIKKEVETANVLWTVGGQNRASTGTDSVKGTSPPFTKTSTLTLEESEWFSGKEVKCSTERDETTFSDKINVKKGGKRPSVLFYKPEKRVPDNETVSLLCEVSSSDLGDVYVMWKKNNGEFIEGSSTVHSNANTVLSYLTVSGQEYNSAQFTCAFKDPSMARGASPEQKTTSMTKFSLKLNPPSVKDLFVRNKAVITCVVTGDIKKEVETANVLWTVGGQNRASTGTDSVKGTTPPFTKTSTLTLEESEWFSGKEVKCSTERDKTPFSQEMKVKKGGKRPSVLFYKPEKRVPDNETVSLLCEVSSSDLGDVYVMWKKNNGEFIEGSSTVHSNANTVLSYLTVSGQEYNSAQFTCAFKDPSMARGASPEQKTTSMTKFSLKLNPPSAKELFVRNKAVITCVVTGENKKEVETANVLWTVGGQNHASAVTDSVKGTTPPFTKTSTLTLEESEWFSGKEVKCSTERDKTPFSQEIKVKKGGKRPSVLIYKPEKRVPDNETVSLLCEVSSSDLGNVYVMWQMNGGEYREGNSTVHSNANTVLSLLAVSGQDYNNENNIFTCSVKDTKTENKTTPKTDSTSIREIPAPDPGLYMNCDKDCAGEDDFNSLWSTASSFIFLFLFTIVYSTVLSLTKMK